MDFSRPPAYYDTFALRDAHGDGHATQTFPYFRAAASRWAQIAGRAIPVQSCWNGMAVFVAAPFYGSGGGGAGGSRNGSSSGGSSSGGSSSSGGGGSDSDSGGSGTRPLRFRGIPDSLAKYHLEASECCLIHVDNPLTAAHGVWMNPHVRVAYTPAAYDAVAGGAGGRLWPTWADRLRGVWRNRFVRWTTSTWARRQRVMARVAKWQAEDAARHHEPGLNCLVNEMQVLVANGWAHV
jgi:hypothetical protein